MSSVWSAPCTSCHQTVGDGFAGPFVRPKKPGFPERISWDSEKLLRSIKVVHSNDGIGPASAAEGSLFVVPYTHTVSHGITKVATRFGARVLFPAPTNKMCPVVNNGVV